MEHPMAETARIFRHREETGEVPESVYYPDAEDEFDPDSPEIQEIVRDQFDSENRNRRERRLMDQREVLMDALRDQGVDPDELLYGNN
jgi:hypothetical protein